MPAAGSAFGGCRCIGEVFEEVFFGRAAEVLEGEDFVGVEFFPGLCLEVHTAFFKCVPPYRIVEGFAPEVEPGAASPCGFYDCGESPVAPGYG